MSGTNSKLHGSCLCGGVAYQVDGLEPNMSHCHCSMCRKFHGAAFATYGEAKRDNFRWLRGESLLKSFQASNGTKRQFCGICGSSMIFQSAKQSDGRVEIALGTLDSALDQRPDAHVYTKHKVSWFEGEDDLPRFSSGREPGASITKNKP